MTTSDLLDMVKTAPAEELPRLAREIGQERAALAEVEAALRLRLNVLEPRQSGTVSEDLTVEEAAAELKVHIKTVYRWASRAKNPLPTVKYGGAVRIPRAAFQAWRRGEP